MVLASIRQLFTSSKPASQAAAPVFALPPGERIYAIGDIHGRAHLLKKMLAAIETHAASHPAARVVEVFLGDYVDRGLESRAVIDMLRSASPRGHERVCLLGNHEETLLRFLEDPKILREWTNYGGFGTLASYGIGIPATLSPETWAIVRDAFARALPSAHREFLQGLRLTYQQGDYLFVHAGIMPALPLAAQRREHLLWIRESFLSYSGYFERYVVHGHSPVASPEILKNRANLDVSAAASDSLCCLVLEGSNREVILMTGNTS